MISIVFELKKQKKVGKAWLGQKVVKHDPKRPVYVIAFSIKGFKLSADQIIDRVIEKTTIVGDFFVVCKSGQTKKIARKVINIGERIL